MDTRLGTQLAGYRIEEVVGRGGMSVVYLAEHLRLKRKVALKLIAPDLAEDSKFRERFLRERSRSSPRPSSTPNHPHPRRGRGGGRAVHRHALRRWHRPEELPGVRRDRGPGTPPGPADPGPG